MKILLIHNYYQQRGGEDSVVEAEMALLQSQGHEVIPFFIYSSDINSYNPIQKALQVLQIPFNFTIYKKLKHIITEGQFDIVHIHNIWPLLSPSVFFACRSAKQVWVQTIHNYRYIVPDAILYIDDLSKNRLNIQKRTANCFKNSYLLTFLYKSSAMIVKKTKILKNNSGKFIVLNKFGYNLFSQVFNPSNLAIKGNFIQKC